MLELWLPTLFSGLILGLFGSTHCLLMCGGLMSALSMRATKAAQNDDADQIATSAIAAPSLAPLVWFNIGRVLGYGLLGLILGMLGSILSQNLANEENLESYMQLEFLRWIAGFMLIAMGLYIGRWWFGLTQLEKLGLPLWKAIQPTLSKWIPLQTRLRGFTVGLVWVFLPCGLIYSSLIWSMSLASPLLSGAAMLAFGLGTLPVLLATSITSQSFGQLLQQKQVRSFAGLALIIFGVWTLASGQLMGH